MSSIKKKKWPHWDLQETTKCEIRRVFANCPPSPDYEWLLSLMPRQNEADAVDGSEWESEDENEDAFPEFISCTGIVPENFHESKTKKHSSLVDVQISKKNKSEQLHGENEKMEECLNLSSISLKDSTSVQESVDVKAIVKIFNDEKRDSEKKKKELIALGKASDAELISLIEEAMRTITCDEKKSAFCILFSEVMKAKTFLLGRYFFLPWFQNSRTNFGIPVETLSQMINLFCENACEDLLLPLLCSPTSCLLNDLHLLKDILSLSDPKYWLFLMRRFLALISDLKLTEWHVRILDLLCNQVDALCDPSFDESLINDLINLLLANAVDFSMDRNFGNILLILITAVQKHKTTLNFVSVTAQLSSIVQFYKGPLRFKAKQVLKKLIAK